MIINDEIYVVLDAHNIERNAGVLYLLSVYYGIDPTNVIDDEIIKRVNITKIVSRDYDKNKVLWLIPLFVIEEVIHIEKQWNWVIDQYRMLFINVKGDKGGTKSSCVDKMKKFFASNPEIRKEDVIIAAKLYTDSFKKDQNPKYMQQADYFISKKLEGTVRSRLEQYLEIVKTETADIQLQTNRFTDKIR